MIAPPGAPGAAIITTPRVKMNGIIKLKLCGMLLIINTPVAQLVMVMVLPAKWMVAQSGTTNSRILLDTPFASAHFTFTGMVIAEL